MTPEQLRQLSIRDIRKIDPGELVDISTVDIDPALPGVQRILSYLDQIKNPYCFLSGKTPVKVSFSDSNRTLSSSLKSYLFSLGAR